MPLTNIENNSKTQNSGESSDEKTAIVVAADSNSSSAAVVPANTSNKSFCASERGALLGMGAISLINGVLYGLTIPVAGGANINKLFGISGNDSLIAVRTLSAGAGLCYTMFYFKTLEFLQMKPTSSIQMLFSFFAPFAASCYLTGGVEGGEITLSSMPTIITIGSILFAFRILGCVDASNKFPNRIKEIFEAWKKAWDKNNYKELTRLILTTSSSLIYSLCATDSIYAASKMILGWCGATGSASSVVSYVFSALGAIGILPLTLYWTHRGLKQLTFGGEADAEGKIIDPTDCFTYLGLLMVLPNILGTVGAATSAEGAVLGKGLVIASLRVSTGTIYAATSGTPGLSTLFRSIANNCKTKEGLAAPLLPPPASSVAEQKSFAESSNADTVIKFSAGTPFSPANASSALLISKFSAIAQTPPIEHGPQDVPEERRISFCERLSQCSVM